MIAIVCAIRVIRLACDLGGSAGRAGSAATHTRHRQAKKERYVHSILTLGRKDPGGYTHASDNHQADDNTPSAHLSVQSRSAVRRLEGKPGGTNPFAIFSYFVGLFFRYALGATIVDMECRISSGCVMVRWYCCRQEVQYCWCTWFDRG